MTITADQLRRARRALGVTQAKLADDTGVNATLIKHFETYRLSALPDSAQKALQDYFDSNGVDMSQLASSQDDAATAASQASKPGSAVVQTIPRAALLPQRLGFLVSNSLSDDEIEDLLQKMDDNDERIYELVKKETQSGLFGGPTEQTVDDNRELFALLAENYLIFRHLQGRNLFEQIDATAEPATHGQLLRSQFVKSPIAPKLLSSGADDANQQNADA